MRMGMIDEIARPGMQNAYHADLPAHVTRVLRQLLRGCGRGLKQNVIEQLLVTAGQAAQFFRQGESQHEVWHRQQQITLQIKPCFGAFLLAFGTVPIAARVIRILRLPATGTSIDLTAQRFGTAMLDGSHRLTMAGQETLRILLTIRRAVLTKDICQF